MANGKARMYNMKHPQIFTMSPQLKFSCWQYVHAVNYHYYLYYTACRKSQNDLHLDPFIPILSFLLLLSYWWNVTHPYYVSSGDRFWVFNHSGVSTSTVFFMQHSTVLCSKVESTHQRYLETGTTLTVTISTESATA